MAYHLAWTDGLSRDRSSRIRPTDDRGFGSIVGESEEIRRAVDAARAAAERRGRTVLLTGESGVGKELFARSIHYAGPDPHAPFVPVGCPTIPAPLLESELFGDERVAMAGERGAKPGLLELAGTGTLFLDEVGELPANLQPKLLRALEERRVRRVGGVDEVEIHCRIVAATSHPMEDVVAEGKFREDLFLRLNVSRIRIPPLRRRGGDVEMLARHFLWTLARDRGTSVIDVTPDAIRALREYAWPGNVRELKSVIQRAAGLAEGGMIGPEHLTGRDRRDRAPFGSDGKEAGRISIPADGLSLEEIEAEAFRITLQITGGNKSAAARILGCSRPTVGRKVELYELEDADARGEDREGGDERGGDVRGDDGGLDDA